MAYRVTFLPMNVTVTVESGTTPRAGSGRAGSLFDLAKKPKALAAYRKLIPPLGR